MRENSTLLGEYFYSFEASRIPPHVLRRGSDRIIRSSKIALVEHAHLVRLERTNDGVQHAAIMEQDEVFFLPVVRVHQLNTKRSSARPSIK